MMRRLFLFLLYWGVGWVAMSCSVSKRIERELRRSPILRQHHVGLSVYDPAKGRTLVAYQDDHYFTPASNTKLLSFYAGLCALGDSLPGLRYAFRADSTLYIEGTGDPSLFHPDLPSSAVEDFLRTTPFKIQLSLHNEQQQRFGPGWAWDDYNDDYHPERSSFPLYGNIVRVSSDSTRLLRTSPRIWQDSLRSDPLVTGLRREEFRNRFLYSRFALPPGLYQDIPVHQSPALTVELLRQALGRSDVTRVEGPVARTQLLHSIPSDSLYKRMLVVSDNMLAEHLMLLYASAYDLPLDVTSAIAHCLENHLTDLPDPPRWRDGSGLSRYNLVTPRSLVVLLDKIYRKVPEQRLFQLLPTGGKTGTLRGMFTEETPFVYAKTGTLSNVFCLSGYLYTRKGKLLYFSFMNNNYLHTTATVRKEVARVLGLLL